MEWSLRNPETAAWPYLNSDSLTSLLSAGLLALKSEAGDEKPLRTVLKQADGDHLHAFLSKVRELTEAHPTLAMLTLPADFYPFQPCSHCFHKHLLLLTEHGAVSVWLQIEAWLDADSETRALVSVGRAQQRTG